MRWNIFCWKKGFDPVTGPPSFPGANFQQMVIVRVIVFGLRNFPQNLKLCHDEKPCAWWLGEKGLGSLQSRLARMLHHEYDALEGYRFFFGGALSFYSVSCMYKVIFNPSLLNWSSLILTVAHIFIYIYIYTTNISIRNYPQSCNSPKVRGRTQNTSKNINVWSSINL